MAGGMQAAIGNNNQQVIGAETSATSTTPSQMEVFELLTKIEHILQETNLPEATVRKTAKYLEAAKIEAEESEPDKQLISKNLERVTKNIEEVDKTVDASKRILDKVIPLVNRIAIWIGVAIGSL